MWFIDSPFFGALIAGVATIATGLFAIKVYKNQKRDEKINAATSILFEIRNAEAQVSIISEKLHSNSTQDLPSVLPTNSWRKFSHLFAKDFDEDELKLMNTFHTSCENIETLANRQNSFIWIAAEERAKVYQTRLAEIHLEFQRNMATGGPTSQVANQTKFDYEKAAITKFYADGQDFYAPQKILDGLRFHINHLQGITTTTCGAKLKKLAKI